MIDFWKMKNFKQITAYALILVINLMFTVKYLSRFLDGGVYLGFFVLGVQIAAIVYFNKNLFGRKIVNYFSILFSLFIIGLVVISHYYIKLESINVDRWSVISSFLIELFKGNYPYYAISHLGNYPGPMPVYFAIALPFYEMGELSVLSSIGYILFVFILYKEYRGGSKNGIVVFLLATSLYVYWEIATRSNIFSYSLFFLLGLRLFLSIKRDKYDMRFFLSAILTGLLLSTRNVFVLAYIVFFFSAMKRGEIKFKTLFIYGLVSTFAFLFTFFPFIIFFKEDFFILNPFIIQSSFLIPSGYIFVFILTSIVLSFLVQNDLDKYFYSGISLFASIAIYFIYHAISLGFNEVLFDNGADISYFLLSIPFLFYYIKENGKNFKLVI
ncbi:MAG: hypothetical protein J7J72_11655 [Bacteroidales bacterium]|nr:hypothetical protein [Bacteroidales bacterium]